MSDDSVVSSSIPSADNSARDELVERLKRELGEKQEQIATLNARSQAFENRERAKINSWQSEIKEFVDGFVAAEAAHDPEAAADIAPLKNWANDYASSSDISSQTGLARFCYVASKGVKRLRDEASRASEAGESLANALKENEALKENVAKLQRDVDDANRLANERLENCDKIQAELVKAGEQKFDFSKVSSRETNAPSQQSEPFKAVAPTSGLEVVSALASKNAAGKQPMTSAAAMANNNANPADALNAFIMASGRSSLKLSSSGTSHALLGSSGENDIASILRGM
jgi:myosin heavy subunit